MTTDFDSLFAKLADLSPRLESGESAPPATLDGCVAGTPTWPGTQFGLLAEAGVLGWVVPREYGGADVSATELIDGYLRLSAACLATTFVLTQRNGACLRIAGSENVELKAELLPALCTADVFATVGISHLTTSRQHLREPAIRATRDRGGFRLSGAAPWVTGGNRADYVVTGGTCDDGRQVLVAVPTQEHGVSVNRPPRLLALNASQTGSVTLDDVLVEDRWLIAGPVEAVMKEGAGGGAGSLTTSALAAGAAAGTLQRLREECNARPDLLDIHEPLAAEQAALADDLRAAAAGGAVSPESIRARANSLVLRAAHAYLTAAKGAGFVAGHPAERAVREATFFLVWSCPQPVQTAALREFACVLGE
jgi:alkylation response protein AidB-like acyl-CoA dehydrogenase